MNLDALQVLRPGPWEIAQLIVLAVLAYGLRGMVRGTRVPQILGGIVVLMLAGAIASALHLFIIAYVLRFVFQYGLIALLIIFAPELRAGLARLGAARLTQMVHQMEQREVTEELSDAIERLSRSSIGAIIAIEREVPLEAFAVSGSQLEAKVSADLIATIFTPYSPLHDGAVIVRGDTIVAAGCILPLSQKPIADRALGTRHRAALGLSDESDALVFVVSEERATVSIAHHGVLWRDLSELEVRGVLSGRLPTRTDPEPGGPPS